MFIEKSPFERLRALIADIEPKEASVDLSVGGPKHAPPPFVTEVIVQNAASFGAYPLIGGTADFQRAVHDWIDRRYKLNGWLKESGAVLPLSGSREGLFLTAVSARDLAGKANPALVFANPFYQAYPAAAHAIGARSVPVAAYNGVLPDWESVPQAVLEDAVAWIIASPSNPEGVSATVSDWHALFDRAERYGFFIFADECYSELYRESGPAPAGALEAARSRPSILKQLFVFNSLSKRSNLPGLRAGFVAGHPETIAAVRDFRNQVGPQVPGPLQAAAAAVFDDEAHVVENRRLYDQKFADAAAILGPRFGPVTPDAGFFLWLPVMGDDVDVVRLLWAEAGVRAVPGSYLALTPDGQKNPGRGFVRLALVADAAVTREALQRVSSVFERGLCRERVAFESVGSRP